MLKLVSVGFQLIEGKQGCRDCMAWTVELRLRYEGAAAGAFSVYSFWPIHELVQLGKDEVMSRALKVALADYAGEDPCPNIKTKSYGSPVCARNRALART